MAGWLLAAQAPAALPAKVPALWVQAKGRLKDEIKIRWAALDRRVEPSGATWIERMTPPVPRAWPPDGKSGYVVYAFAAGMRGSLHDGEEVAAPWAALAVQGGALSVKELGNLRRVGMQGVRPMQASEEEVGRTADAAQQALLTLTRSTQARPVPLIQRYYCQWFGNNVVIAGEVRALHPDFFKWLGCPP
jgi:hypothetical protein